MAEFEAALQFFAGRERRFGRTAAQRGLVSEALRKRILTAAVLVAVLLAVAAVAAARCDASSW